MIYSESLEKAASIAKETIDDLAEEKIVANPQNFAIWFDQLTGRNPELTRIIDRAREQGLEFSPDQMQKIYERFLVPGNSNDNGSDWSQRIGDVATQIAVALRNAGYGTEKYGAILEKFSSNLSGAENSTDLAHMIGDILLSETQSMNGQINNFQDRVSESSGKLEELRQELADTKRDAMTDKLTGLANRRCFDETLIQMTDDARESGEPLCLAICDVDHLRNLMTRMAIKSEIRF